MKKSIYFLWIVVTAIICSVWLSACSNDDPEPEVEYVYGYLFNVRISSLSGETSYLEGHNVSGLESHSGYCFDRHLGFKAKSFTFKTNPGMDVVLESIALNFDTVPFSDIKNGVHTFECGAKLTMISDTEFSVEDLPELSLPDSWQNVARIKFYMKPSISLVKKSSGETESRIYDGEERFHINLCLFDDCYYYPD